MNKRNFQREKITAIMATATVAAAFSSILSAEPRMPFTTEEAVSAVTTAQPFTDNNGQIPPKSQYNGPLFKLSYNWPTKPLPPLQNPPWAKAINNGLITVENAAAYVKALKDYVGPNAKTLVWNYKDWNADKAGWYNQPWEGSIRESIHGTYQGSVFNRQTFPGTGLMKTITTYVLTYYDARAAYAVGQVWGKTAMAPKIETALAQIPEGGVIVKAALVDATAQDWPVMEGAANWPLYAPINNCKQKPSVTTTSFMQFDIIVKDTKSSPKTGWVFTTLVYDTNAPGIDWDKMVPLGAMWGNDPDVNSTADPKAVLNENWINPKAPLYSTQTLGWGGRLSGPNDAARNDIIVGDSRSQKIDSAPNSSCMSCHSPAEWPMKSFLLPSTTYQPTFRGDYLVSPAPGSTDWFGWFQDRPGTQPKDAGTVALDYDMVFAFKSLPMWSKAVGKPVMLLERSGRPAETANDLLYNGKPAP
jgi:hypothetical protein